MSCSRAYEYFMKHMDYNLSVMESLWLERHIAKCEKCREDFMAFEAVLGALSEEAVIETPPDLENLVMDRIKNMPVSEHPGTDKSKRSLIATAAAFGFVVILEAIAFAGIDRAGEIFAYSQFMAYAAFLGTAADYALALLNSLSGSLNYLLAAVSELFDRYSYALPYVVFFLVLLQFALHKKEKVRTNV